MLCCPRVANGERVHYEAWHPPPSCPNTTQKDAQSALLGRSARYAEALVIAFLVVTFLFNTVGVVGSSMRPSLDGGVGSANVLQSLLTGDRVFLPKYDTWLGVWASWVPIAAARFWSCATPKTRPRRCGFSRRPFFIKRLVARGGDRLRIEDGQVYVNGHPVDQSFITASARSRRSPSIFPSWSRKGARSWASRVFRKGRTVGTEASNPSPLTTRRSSFLRADGRRARAPAG